MTSLSATLTDYEIRDLNDEINQLMREKRHYETQIVNLGGANYKRGSAAMVDDEGKEVPGTRGYKYFGRAKELPGVKEMFTKGAQQASEESARNASFQMFRNQGPDYYGDNDEMDEALLAEEDELSRKDWDAAVAHVAATLSLPEDTTVPYPTPRTTPPSGPSGSAGAEADEADGQEEEEVTASSSKTKGKAKGKAKGGKGKGGKGKRKAGAAEDEVDGEAADGVDGDVDGAEGEGKKAKLDGAESTTATTEGATTHGDSQNAVTAAAISYLGVFDADSLRMPIMPTREEMANVLLEVRKRALREEYGV